MPGPPDGGGTDPRDLLSGSAVHRPVRRQLQGVRLLCQIAKHLWYQHLRKANRETELPEEAELPLVPSAEEEAVSRSGQLDMLRRVHELPEPGREVVYLRAFGGLSFREIGDVLGKTETWARVTFYRGKERLKQGGCNDEK